jgi:hypothetical protein
MSSDISSVCVEKMGGGPVTEKWFRLLLLALACLPTQPPSRLPPSPSRALSSPFHSNRSLSSPQQLLESTALACFMSTMLLPIQSHAFPHSPTPSRRSTTPRLARHQQPASFSNASMGSTSIVQSTNVPGLLSLTRPKEKRAGGGLGGKAKVRSSLVPLSSWGFGRWGKGFERAYTERTLSFWVMEGSECCVWPQGKGVPLVCAVGLPLASPPGLLKSFSAPYRLQTSTS